MLGKTPDRTTPCAAAAPLDLSHLERQAMGDRALEAEVLALFAHQAPATLLAIRESAGEERRRLAHRLKGAGRGVGAFAVAAAAEAVEVAPSEEALVAPLEAAIAEALDFIARRLRGES